MTVRPTIPTINQAIYVPTGQAAPSREIIKQPEIARYVEGWGRAGDRGFLALNSKTNQPIGAIWVRLFTSEAPGYGYVCESVPELAMAVLPNDRGQGVGTQLLAYLSDSIPNRSICLSVTESNLVVRLYERFGFAIVSHKNGSITIKRG